MSIDINKIPEILFVTGIGTEVGKSYATGWLAKELMNVGLNPITQKFIQTGNKDYSEDIAVHRKIIGKGFTTEDKLHITAPIILSYPASPHLAEKLDNIAVDYEIATQATNTLINRGYRPVIIEGAGGALVPLRGDWLTADYIAEHNLPAVIVTNGQLGSINHTLLTIESLVKRNIRIWGVIYNPYFDKDEIICHDTREYLSKWIENNLPECNWFEMPKNL